MEVTRASQPTGMDLDQLLSSRMLEWVHTTEEEEWELDLLAAAIFK